ncbi:rod shape-determining protein MreD [Avibacterium paragallinarum]|uniref:Rod shape-determining protein MreD n=1 Tax=Avibacterium paragallinarum TaxID=728 RepID=A0A377I9S7_AVIPA|nr:rod shape-determining protein MreD [Avibacterium paragallinarum]POY46275.1 rod shape-determining protein MreD [Avibacterium paragallinarum]RZN76582.1 rod shape-determining protein MreD [Avibacterium paragallinarum]STO71931.1 rod shape-determining protein MreD/Cell shape-determining protein [Avibacterium paragallinarum]
MKYNPISHFISLAITFLVAIIFEIIPWPTHLQYFKPAWLVLILSYWILVFPTRINIGTAFSMGIIWDLVLGATLGTHALVLSIFAYFLAKNNTLFRNLSLWMQGILIFIAIFLIRFSIFIIELFLHSAEFHWQEVLGAIISGILWPWIFLLLKKLTHKAE